ncbi:MAG: glycosyltransferase family 1 protein [bacterium]
MTIGIDIRVLAKGTRTGVEEYTINLLSHLLPLDKTVKYKLFYNAFHKPILDYDWLNLDNVELCNFIIPNRAFFGMTRYLNQPKVDKLLKGVDVYFNPHFFNAPVSKECRKVVTFHDLSFKRYQYYFSKRKRLWQIFLMNAKREAQTADKIIAVSESTKNDLVNLCKINSDKIQVIYSGVGLQRLGLCKNKGLTFVKNKYNLPDDYVLYFGTIEPRKNIIGLIRAFELLKTKYNFPNLKLVLAGSMGWLYGDVIRTAKKSTYSQDIFFTGFVEETDKPYLYKLADLFVYPSFFEGFGFPPLEAMACGAPVITSNNSSLPEVVGDAALMVDAYRYGDMAWGMNEILTNQQIYDRMIKKGFEQVKKFSWKRCAEKTLKTLCE